MNQAQWADLLIVVLAAYVVHRGLVTGRAGPVGNVSRKDGAPLFYAVTGTYALLGAVAAIDLLRRAV